MSSMRFLAVKWGFKARHRGDDHAYSVISSRRMLTNPQVIGWMVVMLLAMLALLLFSWSIQCFSSPTVTRHKPWGDEKSAIPQGYLHLTKQQKQQRVGKLLEKKALAGSRGFHLRLPPIQTFGDTNSEEASSESDLRDQKPSRQGYY